MPEHGTFFKVFKIRRENPLGNHSFGMYQGQLGFAAYLDILGL